MACFCVQSIQSSRSCVGQNIQQKSNLDEEWNTVEAADDNAVVNISCKDVKSANGSLH